MAILSCPHCRMVLVEEDYDAHELSQHPYWSISLEKKLTEVSKLLERIVVAIERTKVSEP